MNPDRIIIYDLELSTPILTDPAEQEQCNIPFASGWNRYDEMKVACLCAPTLAECRQYSARELFDGDLDRYFWGAMHWTEELLHLVENVFSQADLLVSYNGLSFDNNVLIANGAYVNGAKCYDILAEWKRITGKRVGLDALARANGIEGKSGSGASAPFRWSAGERRDVVEYCFDDCRVTARLFEFVLAQKPLINPHGGTSVLLPMPTIGGRLF